MLVLLARIGQNHRYGILVVGCGKQGGRRPDLKTAGSRAVKIVVHVPAVAGTRGTPLAGVGRRELVVCIGLRTRAAPAGGCVVTDGRVEALCDLKAAASPFGWNFRCLLPQ
jgi:hypothetical protein